MEFSEIKMIWDSQNQEPLYAMNENALHSIVQRRNQETNRCLARCFALEIGVGLLCVVVMFVYAGVLVSGNQQWVIKPWGNTVTPTGWDLLGLLVAGAIWAYYAAYMYRSRKQQQKRVELFDSSLRGDLDRALSQTDFQIKMTQDIVWWGLVPVWVAGTLWLVVLFHLKGAPAWVYVLMIAVALGALVVVVSGKQRAITNWYEPRRRELESLRSKLADTAR